jgi:hypothetical protein
VLSVLAQALERLMAIANQVKRVRRDREHEREGRPTAGAPVLVADPGRLLVRRSPSFARNSEDGAVGVVAH